MPDICDLVLDDHEQFRRRFAELDELRARGAKGDELAPVWRPLAAMLERHASAEESLFYPRLLRRGANPEEETEDAIGDHNKIRDAIAEAGSEEPGSDKWWSAVLEARQENSSHIAEEEREALPDFREHVDARAREDLGAEWLRFSEEHAGARGLSLENEDTAEYIRQNS